LAALHCVLAGRIIMVAECMEQIKLVNAKSAEVYRYMNFDQIPAFVEQAATVKM
jgi:aconitate hydratase 2/2-methylisocitrate dehydratase